MERRLLFFSEKTENLQVIEAAGGGHWGMHPPKFSNFQESAIKKQCAFSGEKCMRKGFAKSQECFSFLQVTFSYIK